MMRNASWLPIAMLTLAFSAPFLVLPASAGQAKMPAEKLGKTQVQAREGVQQLDAVYTAYLDIATALSKDDYATARKVSRAFLEQKNALPDQLSPGVTSKTVLADFEALNKTGDLKSYRQAFNGLSATLISLMKEAKYSGKTPVLLYHCPMANGNKGGSWLQGTQGTANPYYGSEMYACGGLKKTLHAGQAAKKEGHADHSGHDHGAHGHHAH